MQRPKPCLRAFGLLIFPFLFLLSGQLAGCGSSNDLSFPTENQAVFLDNGQVFFGKLEGGGSYLTLKEDFGGEAPCSRG
jgi:hypothetical protein